MTDLVSDMISFIFWLLYKDVVLLNADDFTESSVCSKFHPICFVVE